MPSPKRLSLLTRCLLSLVICTMPAGAFANTYKVGSSRAEKTLSSAFLATLKPGDVVEVDGDQTYAAFSLTQSGTALNPITIRGIAVNGKRPLIQSSGGYTVTVFRSDYNVIEGF